MTDSSLPHWTPADARAFERGAALFARGEWWEAHEAWEEPWLRASGPDRAFLQGVILLAAALHKRWHHGSLTHRNYHKAARHLDTLPPVYAGVNLTRLRAEVWEALHDPALRPALHPA
ncbi:hypothetical protein GCM10008959_06690 [Deinococcus seoulensis]|uniref:DUF309 domain-containing protein n=2 Tax=Deinococcus TaxID=1298 RepID=A0ABQ2RLX7_9DEIO|nr:MULTISPECIES: DUF309 domain-containing protein [Deinococcus]GGR48342.1 hypothetical protein GCM10008959_06690 [Deinococcus seoulensis]GGS20097.1 hypothetical protein GCM10008961_09660 [Deinococcus knuensis]